MSCRITCRVPWQLLLSSSFKSTTIVVVELTSPLGVLFPFAFSTRFRCEFCYYYCLLLLNGIARQRAMEWMVASLVFV